MIIDKAKGIPSAGGVVRLDGRHAERPRRLRPLGRIQVFLHLHCMSAAEHKDLLDSDGFEPGEGVLDHGNIRQGQKDLKRIRDDRIRVRGL